VSTELAVSAITRALRNLMIDGVKLDDGAVPLTLTKGLEHTTLPLHRIREQFKVENVVNVLLYRIEPNAAWRNHPLPSQTRPGESGPPPLAINLGYLITAYGEEDREEVGHFILAQAMRVLHDHPFVTRDRLKTALEAAHVHDQLENVKITPHTLNVEELSKLWTVFQTQYRLSAAYEVTVVLIDSRVPLKSALPVLKRGPDDRGVDAVASAPPLLASAVPASGFPSVRLGEELVVSGERLDGTGLKARVRHPLLANPIDLDVTPVSASTIRLTIPDASVAGTAAKWPAGLYSLSLLVTNPSGTSWTTNDVPFALAPSITVAPLTHAAGTFAVTVEARPQIRAAQTAVILWDGTQIIPHTPTTAAGDDSPTVVTFDITAAIGLHRVRLRVGGVDSIPIKRIAGVLDFDPDQTVQV
jgi:hypothetical protein